MPCAGRACLDGTANSGDEFVELDDEGNPVGKEDRKNAPRRAPAKKGAPRRTDKRDA